MRHLASCVGTSAQAGEDPATRTIADATARIGQSTTVWLCSRRNCAT